jgi:hypothetical protein
MAARVLGTDDAAVRARAGRLGDVLAGVGGARALAGRHIGLVNAPGHEAIARALEGAAHALGAQVSHVRAGLGATGAEADVATAARLLGRLYDAVAFVDAPRELLEHVGEAAGIPLLQVGDPPDAPPAGADDPARPGLLRALLLEALG